MNAVIERKFESIGARAKISELDSRHTMPIVINIHQDEDGEFFDLQVRKEVELLVLDAQKKDRHLLLMARDPKNPKAKFLCGHDERHWFSCAIPERAPASNVFQAKQALKPAELQEIEAREGIKKRNAHKRHRKLESGRKIHRQGEFMFIPMPNLKIAENLFPTVILKNEPMRRGRSSNAHMAEFLHRRGGETVYVCGRYSETRDGLLEKEYKQFIRRNPDAMKASWTIMKRNAEVYVRGKITHVQHKTVDLKDVWHKVVLNTEDKAAAAINVAFLD